MVSELSARLMRGGAHQFSSFPSTTKTSVTSSSSRNNYGSKKIYSDLNSRARAVVSPTGSDNDADSCEMYVRQTAKRSVLRTSTEKLDEISKKGIRSNNHISHNDQGCFKRRKIDELQFAAATCKNDLEKGNLSYPSLDTSLRHHLDFDNNVSTRGIELVSSKSVSSPFLTNIPSSVSLNASMLDYGNLFSATYDCYSSNVTAASPNSDWSSLCSLASDNESSIPARLEDALLLKQEQLKVSSGDDTNNENNAKLCKKNLECDEVFANPITIREAFDNSHVPRLVTLSFAPFLVVHANPAYSNMTGLAPQNILGKPFHEVFENFDSKKTLSKDSTLVSLHMEEMALASKSKDDAHCRIHVSVVGPDNATANQIKKSMTHFMVSLEKVVPVNNNTEEAVSEEPFFTKAAGNTSVTTLEQAAAEAAGSNSGNDNTSAVLPLVLPLPSLLEPPNVRLLSSMRLHCGVMG